MTVRELNENVEKAISSKRAVFQTIYDNLPTIQKKIIISIDAVKELFDRYGVIYE